MRPDYCPVANEPCQLVCRDGCRLKKNSRSPLKAAQIDEMWRATTFSGNGGQYDWFVEGIRAAERAHKIGEVR